MSVELKPQKTRRQVYVECLRQSGDQTTSAFAAGLTIQEALAAMRADESLAAEAAVALAEFEAASNELLDEPCDLNEWQSGALRIWMCGG